MRLGEATDRPVVVGREELANMACDFCGSQQKCGKSVFASTGVVNSGEASVSGTDIFSNHDSTVQETAPDRQRVLVSR